MTALKSDFAEIITLLKDADLCFEDLAPEHMLHFVVIRDGNEIAGTVGLEVFGSNALLRSLVVAKSHRGKQLGVQLIDEIEDHSRAVGVTALYLLTTTADQFFDRKGYKRIDRTDVPESIGGTNEFASFCPDSAICMRKQLPAVAE